MSRYTELADSLKVAQGEIHPGPTSDRYARAEAALRVADQNEEALIKAGTEAELALMKSERTLTGLVAALGKLLPELRDYEPTAYHADLLSDVLRTYGVRVD